MKQFNRIFWGLSFIAIATLLVLTQMNLITVGFSVAQVILAAFAILFIWISIESRSPGVLFIPVGLIWIGFGEMMGLPAVPVWVVIVVMALLAIGLAILLPKKKHNHNAQNYDRMRDEFHDNKYQKVENEQKNGYVYCSNRFGSLAKYITESDLKKADLRNAFGEMKVYLDQAKVSGNSVVVDVNNSFGQMQLYIPSDWSVSSEVSVFAGAVNEINNNPNMVGGPEVHLVGNVSFGEVQINYV